MNIAIRPDTQEKATCPDGYGLSHSKFQHVNKTAIHAVLGGDTEELGAVCVWYREKHGMYYWLKRSLGQKPLSETDKQFLRFLLEGEYSA